MGQPIISIKEARKQLGSENQHLTDEEIEAYVQDLETVIRLIVRHFKCS